MNPPQWLTGYTTCDSALLTLLWEVLNQKHFDSAAQKAEVNEMAAQK